jgi:hypothetical protein
VMDCMNPVTHNNAINSLSAAGKAMIFEALTTRIGVYPLGIQCNWIWIN